jgi:hypothetical protein
MRALLLLVALTAACVPSGAQAAVPVLAPVLSYDTATVKAVTVGAVTCFFFAQLSDYFPSAWQSEIVCRDAAGDAQLQVRRAGEKMQGSYPFPAAGPAIITWIVTPGPGSSSTTAGVLTGMKLHFGAIAADGTEKAWDRTF